MEEGLLHFEDGFKGVTSLCGAQVFCARLAAGLACALVCLQAALSPGCCSAPRDSSSAIVSAMESIDSTNPAARRAAERDGSQNS
jgi:hypothetical protein